MQRPKKTKKANAKGKRKQQAGSKQKPDAARKMDEGQKPSSKELEYRQLSLAWQRGEDITPPQLKELSLYDLSYVLKGLGRELRTAGVNDYTRQLAQLVFMWASHFDPELTKRVNRQQAKRAAGVRPGCTIEEAEKKIGPCTDLPLKDPAEIKLSSYCEEIRKLVDPVAREHGALRDDPDALGRKLARIGRELEPQTNAGAQEMTVVTLREFMKHCCTPLEKGLRKARLKALQRRARRPHSNVAFPDAVGGWQRGQSKKYKAAELAVVWPRLCEKMSNLPPLNQEYLRSQLS